MRGADIEVRDAPTEQAGSLIRGYAALYSTPVTIGGEFIEQISPGAFSKTITNGDVLALIAHDWARVIGRQSAGTLRLTDTPIGLAFELDADVSTPSGQEVLGNVRRRDVKGCSFGFRVLWDDWSDDGAIPVRTIREIELHEVSILANPAYEMTSAWVSSRASNANTNNQAARRRVEAKMRKRGIPMT
ncbi:HK97 family phage prohead protease [Bradyrhizobium japonicum]